MKSAFCCVILTLLLARPVFCAPSTASATTHPSPDAIVQYLNQTIDWYRRVVSLEQSSGDSREMLLRATLLQNARQVVQLGFRFARAEAAIMDSAAKNAPTSARGQSEAQAAAAAREHAAELREQIAHIDQQLQNAPGDGALMLYAKRYELVARLNLANTQRDVHQEYASFIISADNGDGAALSRKIDELRRSVPDIQLENSPPPTTAPSSPPDQTSHAESTGIFGLINEMLTLSGRMSEINTLEEAASDLRSVNDRFREPIRQAAIETLRASENVGATTEPALNDPNKIESRGMQIDVLTDRFKQLSSASTPLREQSLVIDAGRDSLIDWHTAITRHYDEAFHSLLLRLGMLFGVIIVIFVISELWKRATFKYIKDQRRQRQIIFIRRIVIGLVVLIIIIASVVSEFGSLATFAGLITAGVAVALQTVILSGVAYFFFIGRFGVRVGDRVTITNITGDVIEIGLFRIYLMELGGKKTDLHPTGRVVVFSNSVLFQPSAFYKQLPGSDYIWHEVALTLVPESDPRVAEERLLHAVNEVFGEYQQAVQDQHDQIARALHVDMGTPKPEGRLRFVEDGLEFVVRYPVELNRASQIDERITRELLKAINEEPKLKMVASGMPQIRTA